MALRRHVQSRACFILGNQYCINPSRPSGLATPLPPSATNHPARSLNLARTKAPARFLQRQNTQQQFKSGLALLNRSWNCSGQPDLSRPRQGGRRTAWREAEPMTGSGTQAAALRLQRARQAARRQRIHACRKGQNICPSKKNQRATCRSSTSGFPTRLWIR